MGSVLGIKVKKGPYFFQRVSSTNQEFRSLTFCKTAISRRLWTAAVLEIEMTSITDYIKAWLRWPPVWWFVRTFGLPLFLPLVVFHYFNYYKYQKSKRKLEGKVVLITGASSGLGEALAHSFYKAGCRIILSSRREKELERVRDMLLQMYETSPTYPPVVLPLDVSDINIVLKQAEKALSIFGHIDILINNAGVSYRGSVLNTKHDVDANLMAINYLGPVALTKAILPNMVGRKEGHIVAISSVQGLIGLPYRSAYTATKHALQAFHDSLRAEVAQHNIKVTVISPGYIRTNLSVNALTGDGGQYGVMDETTAKGQEPSELAEILLKNVVQQKDELVIAPLSTKLAIILRNFYPPLYFWIMRKRAITMNWKSG